MQEIADALGYELDACSPTPRRLRGAVIEAISQRGVGAVRGRHPVPDLLGPRRPGRRRQRRRGRRPGRDLGPLRPPGRRRRALPAVLAVRRRRADRHPLRQLPQRHRRQGPHGGRTARRVRDVPGGNAPAADEQPRNLPLDVQAARPGGATRALYETVQFLSGAKSDADVRAERAAASRAARTTSSPTTGPATGASRRSC